MTGHRRRRAVAIAALVLVVLASATVVLKRFDAPLVRPVGAAGVGDATTRWYLWPA